MGDDTITCYRCYFLYIFELDETEIDNKVHATLAKIDGTATDLSLFNNDQDKFEEILRHIQKQQVQEDRSDQKDETKESTSVVMNNMCVRPNRNNDSFVFQFQTMTDEDNLTKTMDYFEE